jgi:dolichol-phosphate mannosyltransferase
VTRFIRFNAVGALGLGVQLAVLAALGQAGWPLVPATLAAVEIAVLHNFFWHERWTWADRRGGSRIDRLVRFHASNGLMSLVGNAVLTWCFAALGLRVTLANLAAVASCAVVNFAAGDRLVYRREHAGPADSPHSLNTSTAR